MGIAIGEVVGKNLHVAGEDEEVRFILVDEILNLLFGDGFVVFANVYYCVGNFVKVGDGLIVGVIGNDERDVAVQFSAVLTVEQVDEAVVVFGNEDDAARAVGR